MKRNLQFLSMLLLMIVGGASFSWAADFLKLHPSAEKGFRASYNTESSTAAYNSGFPKDFTTVDNYEMGYAQGFFVLQQFTINTLEVNLEDVQSITLTYAAKENEGQYMGFWIYDADFPTETSQEAKNKVVSTIQTTIGQYPNSVSMAVNGLSSATTKVVKCGKTFRSATFTGEALTTLKNKLRGEGSTKTITFIITRQNNVNSDSNKPKIYSNNDANANIDGIDLRPTLVMNKPVYNATAGSWHETIYDAISGKTDDTTLEIYDDTPIHSSSVDTRWSQANKTLTITPMNDDVLIFRGEVARGKIWLNVNANNAIINIGSDSHQLIFADDGTTELVNATLQRENSGSQINLTNVKFRNFKWHLNNTENGRLFFSKNVSSGKFSLNKVTLENCTTDNDAFIVSDATNDNSIQLLGYLNIDNCTGTTIATGKRIQMGTENAIYNNFSASNNISIIWKGTRSIGAGPVVIKTGASYADKFVLSDELYSFKRNAGNGDLSLTQCYILNVNNYSASTLVLPFESVIPSGVSAYKLNYYKGDENARAVEIATPLPANTPVLINAAEGSYKFETTATSGDAVSGEGNPSVGALVGTYTDATPVAEGNYVLYANKSNPIGFYKAGAGVTINANRAYLKSEGGSLARLAIVYGDETNAIEAVKAGIADDAIYTLSGIRVEQPTRGIYVKNGKKFIVK